MREETKIPKAPTPPETRFTESKRLEAKIEILEHRLGTVKAILEQPIPSPGGQRGDLGILLLERIQAALFAVKEYSE